MGLVFKNFTSELMLSGAPLSDWSDMMLRENDGKLECRRYVVNVAPSHGEGENALKDYRAGEDEPNEDQGGADNNDGDYQQGGGDDQADANGESGAGGDSGDGSGAGGDGKDDKEKDSDKVADDKKEEEDSEEKKDEDEQEEELFDEDLFLFIDEGPEAVGSDDGCNASKTEGNFVERKEKTKAPEDLKESVMEPGSNVVEPADAELTVSGEKSISLSPGKVEKKFFEEDKEMNGNDPTAKRIKTCN